MDDNTLEPEVAALFLREVLAHAPAVQDDRHREVWKMPPYRRICKTVGSKGEMKEVPVPAMDGSRVLAYIPAKSPLLRVKARGKDPFLGSISREIHEQLQDVWQLNPGSDYQVFLIPHTGMLSGVFTDSSQYLLLSIDPEEFHRIAVDMLSRLTDNEKAPAWMGHKSVDEYREWMTSPDGKKMMGQIFANARPTDDECSALYDMAVSKGSYEFIQPLTDYARHNAHGFMTWVSDRRKAAVRARIVREAAQEEGMSL